MKRLNATSEAYERSEVPLSTVLVELEETKRARDMARSSPSSISMIQHHPTVGGVPRILQRLTTRTTYREPRPP